MHFHNLFYFCLSLILLSGCIYRPKLPDKGVYLVDSGKRNIATLDVGSSLEAGARGLTPHQSYISSLVIRARE